MFGFMPDVGTSSSRPTPRDGYRTSLDPPTQVKPRGNPRDNVNGIRAALSEIRTI